MIDISAVGSSVLVKMGSGREIYINEFSDEGTPFECPDVDLSQNEKNLSGQMISSRKVSVYTLSVTVIPGSEADIALTEEAQKAALFHGNIVDIGAIKVGSITLTVPKIYTDASGTSNANQYISYTWTNGRMKSAPTGPSTSAEGRLSARTFVFEMEKFSPPSGDGQRVR